MKRKHQIEMERTIDDIIDGRPTKYILAMVTPGGGKSALPMIAGRLIRTGMADKICWVAPRTSLQVQGESNFIDPFFRKMFDHDLTIRTSTNEQNPCRGLDGFVTTYQAIGIDGSHTVLREFQARRYILVLDEFHHAEAGGVWHKKLKPLVEKAAYVLLMTGTMERGDGGRIAFAPYTEHLGKAQPMLRSSDELGLQVIQYSRTDALAEKAIIPLNFHFADGSATWRVNGADIDTHYDSIAGVGRDDAAAALYTAISTKFAKQLLELGISHWIPSRRDNPNGKLLVVTAGIKHARDAMKHLSGFRADIATSHESKAASKAIARFRAGELDVLVTIAMAYEGMDVPAVSHIVSLTHIRSRPWIEQMLARSVRVDPDAGPWETQNAQVYTPDDPVMRELVAKIESEQEPYVKNDRGEQLGLFESPGAPAGAGDGSNPYGIIPLASALTGRRNKLLGPGSAPPPGKTPSEREAELREKIESHVRAYAYRYGIRNNQINGEILRDMGKPRDKMTLGELSRCLEHVRRAYPLMQKRAYQL